VNGNGTTEPEDVAAELVVPLLRFVLTLGLFLDLFFFVSIATVSEQECSDDCAMFLPGPAGGLCCGHYDGESI
jgi:hypothetical protein